MLSTVKPLLCGPIKSTPYIGRRMVRFKQASVVWVLQMDSSLTHCKEAPTRSESPRLSPLLKR